MRTMAARAALVVGLWAVAGTGAEVKNRMIFFYVDWCLPDPCEPGLKAIDRINAEIESNQQYTSQAEAMAINCASPLNAPTCCKYSIDTYPSVVILPNTSRTGDTYFDYRGYRSHAQMRFALLEDTAPRAFSHISKDRPGGLSCFIRAIRASSEFWLTRTIFGSAILGSMIGLLMVYIVALVHSTRLSTRGRIAFAGVLALWTLYNAMK